MSFLKTAATCFGICTIFFLLFHPFDINAVELAKDQQEMVEELGHPDSFTLIIVEEDENPGIWHRMESWDYYKLETSFSFVDGTLSGSYDIKDFPSFTLLPNIYTPEQFENGMRLQEVEKKIIADRPFGKVDLQKEILPEAKILGTEQLIMGFIGDMLVYVETLPLLLEGQEER